MLSPLLGHIILIIYRTFYLKIYADFVYIKVIGHT